jgi:hypothetical protein
MPRDITITFEDGTNHVYKGAPDNITPDAVEARAMKEFGKSIVNLDGGRPPASESTSEKRQNVKAEPDRGLVDKTIRNVIGTGAELASLGAGAYKGVGDIVLGGQKLIGQGVETVGNLFPASQNLSSLVTGQRVLNPVQQAGKFLTEDAARRQAMQEEFIKPYRNFAPNITGTGEFGGEVLATLPVGGAIAKPVQMLGKFAPSVADITAPIAQSLKTGGFNTGLLPKVVPGAAPVAAPLGTRIANKLVQTVGGATVGGATSALINPAETETGAIVGGILPTVAPPVVKFIAAGAGKVIDAATGNLVNTSAGKVAREAAGDFINQIRSANGVAPLDINAAQAAYGIDNNTYQAFLSYIAGKDLKSALSGIKTQQGIDNFNVLARLTGGATETEALSNIAGSKQVLNKLTTPIRESALGKVDETGRVMPALTKEAEQLRQTAASKVADVRRFAGAQARAINPAEDNLATDYLLGKLANSADETAGKAALESLTAGGGARTAEAKLAELQQAGLKPIYSTDIASKIENIANQPGVRADDIQRATLLKLRDKFIDIGSPSNGIMIGEDLNQIRKTSINDAINKALSEAGYDPKAQSQRLAGLLGDVRSHIDEAIRGAGGGKDWDAYLSTFSKGRQQLDQRVAAGQLAKILEKDPQKFVDIVKGKDPDFVEKIFGAGNKDIIQAMGGQRPKSPMVKLFSLADDVERDLKIEEQVKAGSKSLSELKELNKKSLSNMIVGFMGFKTAAAKKSIETLENRLAPKIMAALVKGAESGKSMNEILDALPADDRIKALKAFKDMSSAAQSGVASLNTTPSTNRNKLAPEQPNQNALAR